MSSLAWTVGAERMAEDVYRIPLPIPDAALRAVNVYAIVAPSGAITLIDAGWEHPDTLACLQRSMAGLGLDLDRLDRVLVTHAHPDHYSLAAELRRRYGARIGLGAHESAHLRAIQTPGNAFPDHHFDRLRAAGAHRVIRELRLRPKLYASPVSWADPDDWIRDGELIDVGARTIRAIRTPGHTAGHLVFVDERAGLVFTGDHVLPHISPTIAFELAHTHLPLERYLDSLAKMQRLSARSMLPAHGPAGGDLQVRVTELLDHHELRLIEIQRVLDIMPSYSTAYEVATRLSWTRRNRELTELSPVHQLLAVSETVAHLELLVARECAYSFDGTPVRYLSMSACPRPHSLI